MKKLLLLFLILTVNCKQETGNLFAQNLVPNPSFEDTVACPIGYNQVENAVGWINFRSSPDYFHSCATTLSGVSVPSNPNGYQCPANGNAYFGIIPFTTLWNNYREFFGIQLSNPLVMGQKYYVSFKISLSDQSICGCNKLGVLFSTIKFPLDTFGTSPLNNFAHVYTDSIIIDTVNWTTLLSSFVADSNYTYIMLGNFFDDANTDTIRFYPVSGCTVYYFIEDVCVSTDPLTCVIPNGPNICDTTVNISETILNKELFVIYPNPTKGNIFIKQPQLQKANIKIYNLFGQLIFENIFFEKSIEINLSLFHDGVYIIQLIQNNKVFNKKITLIK